MKEKNGVMEDVVCISYTPMHLASICAANASVPPSWSALLFLKSHVIGRV